MNSESRVSVRWPVLVVAAVVLLAVGAGAAYVGMRSRAPDRPSSNEQATMPGTRVPAAGPTTEQRASGSRVLEPLPDVVVTLRGSLTRSSISRRLSAPVLPRLRFWLERRPEAFERRVWSRPTPTNRSW